ncbi:TNFA factor, partial [Galbula dea]|nr:TNFA factor [Galbula dea]
SRYSEEYPRDVPLLSAVRSVCAGGGAGSGSGRGGRRRRRQRQRRHLHPPPPPLPPPAPARSPREAQGRQVWFESLYQGAVFPLRRGDQLAATTTGSRFLDLHGAGQAYF